MNLIAFKMKLHPGCQNEYKRRHDNLWHQMQELLNASGVHNYHIFLDPETSTLFAVQAADYRGDLFENNDILKKWWDYMADIMVVNPDNSPVILQLEQVFKFK